MTVILFKVWHIACIIYYLKKAFDLLEQAQRLWHIFFRALVEKKYIQSASDVPDLKNKKCVSDVPNQKNV